MRGRSHGTEADSAAPPAWNARACRADGDGTPGRACLALGGDRLGRAGWGIGNRLHRVMDVVFHDDIMRPRTGAGPADKASVRHAALNFVRTASDKRSIKSRRKLA